MQPVQQGSGEAFRAEGLGPFVEGQVGGHYDGAPLVALAEDLEDQFRPGPVQLRTIPKKAPVFCAGT